ncbi:MAG: hypothetical protein Fur0041_03980 [Bacteroidia bacterium]
MTRTLLNWIFLLFLLVSPSVQLIAQRDGGPGNDNTSIFGGDQQDEEDKKKKKKDKEEQSDANFFSLTMDRFNAAFFARLGLNLLSMIVLIRFIYFPVYKRRDYFFTFFMFNITIFVISFLLNSKTSFSTGAAFGLFAVFSLLRYRTEDISARDMTYLFTVIALGLVTSVNKGTMLESAIINAIILLAAFALDGNMLMKTEFVKTIQYENIDLIRPENSALLLEDLRKRTGLNIHKVSVGKVDFLKDTATVKIYYYESKSVES